jgi:hypothetical protein
MGKVYSVEDVASHLGVSTQTVRRNCERGYFPGAYRKSPMPGSAWQIPESALRSFERARMGQKRP